MEFSFVQTWLVEVIALGLAYYLTYKKKIGYNPKLILSGRSLNDQMPELIFKEIKKKLNLKKLKNLKF